MKIALISPKAPALSTNLKIQKTIDELKEFDFLKQNWRGLSYGLLIIAALTPASYEIDFIDENYDPINFSIKYDLVAISASTTAIANRAYQIADQFRKERMKVVIGGIHATVLPEEAKEHADSVIIGESEYLWPILINDLEKNNLNSFYKTDKLVNLREIPPPRYDLLKADRYRIIWLQTARGCPHDCEICAASKVYGKKYRRKDVEQVVNEIKFIKQKLGNIPIGFSDDNLFVDKKYLKLFLERIIPLKIRWYGMTDISIGSV